MTKLPSSAWYKESLFARKLYSVASLLIGQPFIRSPECLQQADVLPGESSNRIWSYRKERCTKAERQPEHILFWYPSGPGEGPPRCGQTAEQPGPAVSESGQIWGGGILLLSCPGDLRVQAGPRWSKCGQNQEQPGEREVDRKSTRMVLFPVFLSNLSLLMLYLLIRTAVSVELWV